MHNTFFYNDDYIFIYKYKGEMYILSFRMTKATIRIKN